MTSCTSKIKQHGIVFTPTELVNEMLDKLPEDVWEPRKTFCDPASGDGQFLVHILRRKIAKGHDPLEALKTLYGADIIISHVRRCRRRLLKVIAEHGEVKAEHIRVVFQNIVFLSQTGHPKGSLDYEFEFKNHVNERNVQEWLAKNDFLNEEDYSDLPVDADRSTPAGGTIDMLEEYDEFSDFEEDE